MTMLSAVPNCAKYVSIEVLFVLWDNPPTQTFNLSRSSGGRRCSEPKPRPPVKDAPLTPPRPRFGFDTAGELAFASTRIRVPSISCSIWSTALNTASSKKFTKPKPLLRPVAPSIMTMLCASPNCLKYASNDSFVVLWDKPPTQIFNRSLVSIGEAASRVSRSGAWPPTPPSARVLLRPRLPPKPKLPLRPPLCFALLPCLSTLTAAPSISCCIERTALSTASSAKFTKPNPRLRPVALSIMTMLSACPNWLKYALRVSLVVSCDSPPTKIFSSLL
mmetsp:Transcript_84749/g.236528  ORF Transcript_84749/g.236528 Transcript_84749/m.236528 type:complete len:276 (+) Transcript_84749:652-1479(+)